MRPLVRPIAEGEHEVGDAAGVSLRALIHQQIRRRGAHVIIRRSNVRTTAVILIDMTPWTLP